MIMVAFHFKDFYNGRIVKPRFYTIQVSNSEHFENFSYPPDFKNRWQPHTADLENTITLK